MQNGFSSVLKKFTVFLSSTIMLVSLTACSSQPEPVLRVGTNLWPGYETLHLAQSLGYFDSKTIKLKGQTSATEVLRAFKQNQIDVAALTLDEVLLLAQSESDLRVFLILDISNGGDKVMARPEITQLSELKGKCIASENNALGAFMMHQVLDAAELDTSDVRIQTVTIDRHVKYMTNNKCDAVITFEPVVTKLSNLGFVDIFNSSQIPGKIIDVLVTKQSVIDTQKENLSQLVAAQWMALAYLQKEPQDAYKRIIPRLGITTAELESSYQGLTLPDKHANQALFNSGNSLNLYATVDELSAILLDAKLLRNAPHTQHLITDEFIK